MEGVIYRFYNVISNKSYIGQTIQEKRRENDFFNENKEYTKYGSKIDNARLKYGLSRDIWKKEVLKKIITEDKEILHNELNKWEKFYIEKYNTFNDGYNSTTGGDNCFNISVENKDKCKFWQDKHMTPYICDKLRNIMSSKHHDKKTKEKIKETLSKNKNYNKKFNRKIYKCDINNHDIILKEYESISSVENDSFSKESVRSCLRGKQKSSQGYFWKYKEETHNIEIIGCYFLKKLNRWRSRISYKGKTYNLGCFKTEKEGNAMYNVAKKIIENGINFEEWYYNNIENEKNKIRNMN